MLKRPRDAFDTPDSSSPPLPASKRRFLTSSSPAGPSGSSPGTIRTTPLSTPYTLPYFRSPFALSVPHDSPSNPFGLNRALRALTLPRPTGFSKHIVLRMQLVSTTASARRRRLSSRRVLPPEMPYRIVQVPLNYSFRLLHMLLLFLFASDARLRVRRPKGAAAGTARKDTGASLRASTSKDAQESAESEGHLFEVFENIKLYANKYRPGVIKAGTGTLYARLSSTRERKLFPDEIAVDDENVFMTGDVDDDDGWVWEAEDDYLLSNVWSEGPDLKKGIIYHHTATTAIHITANQSRVPPRKGIGNTPHVFAAHGGTAGAVRMANVAPSPPASSSAPPSKANVSTPKRRRKRDPDSSSHTSHSDSGSASGSGSGWSSSSSSSSSARKRKRAEEPPPINDGEEVPDLRPHEDASEEQLERWNAHRAFERFLKREAARERAMRRVSNPNSKPSSRASAREARAGTAPSARRARPMQGDGMSSPLRPRPHGTHVYGRQYEYAGRERDVLVPSHDDATGTDADADADALPPSSPSTLPVVFPSDCDVWTDDTDGEPGYASGSGKERGEAGEDEDEDAAENRRYMIELQLQTPFPAHPALRRRVRRASEKIERQHR
ncbi:hypothetical protein PYCCODRAFT_396555 [Trametes coccinea BRFM310]|uniref:Uncharacterized protein n=1 Tax=Trametes coccinea (strain BRFM310) TaxID=1353009 RepID=A0A1Y2J472_TRAC3|nr:hypothetical protein PYCCODRAFT_396555 [Trametes coccinea BRFM310]